MRDLFDHFMMQFGNALAKHAQDGGPLLRQLVVTPAAESPARLDLTPQPSVALHPFQQWIEGAGADVVPVTSQLAEHPLTDHRTFRRVVEDVHLPEPQQDLTRDQLAIGGRHSFTLAQRSHFRINWCVTQNR